MKIVLLHEHKRKIKQINDKEHKLKENVEGKELLRECHRKLIYTREKV